MTFVNALLHLAISIHPREGITDPRLVGLNVVHSPQILIKIRLPLFGCQFFVFLPMCKMNAMDIPFVCLSARARVCVIVGLHGGITGRDLATVLGMHYVGLMNRILCPMLSEGLIGRVRSGNTVTYHTRKLGRQYVRAEQRRLISESLGMLDRCKKLPRCKVDLVDDLVNELRISPSSEK